MCPWSPKPLHPQGPHHSSLLAYLSSQYRWLWFRGHSTGALFLLSTWPQCLSKSPTQHFPLLSSLSKSFHLPRVLPPSPSTVSPCLDRITGCQCPCTLLAGSLNLEASTGILCTHSEHGSPPFHPLPLMSPRLCPCVSTIIS